MATTGQIRIIKTLMGKMGVGKDKEAQQAITGKASVKDLTTAEAAALIPKLQQQTGIAPASPAKQRMVRKMIAMCYEQGKGSPDTQEGRRTAVRILDGWSRKYGYLKKGLNAYDEAELPMLVTQWEKVYKSYLNSI